MAYEDHNWELREITLDRPYEGTVETHRINFCKWCDFGYWGDGGVIPPCDKKPPYSDMKLDDETEKWIMDSL